MSDWRDGLSREERIDIRLKADNIDPTSAAALAVAYDEWRDYDAHPLNDVELESTARNTLTDIIRRRERN